MLTLPQRFGEKPKTHYGLPHTQLDQTPAGRRLSQAEGPGV